MKVELNVDTSEDYFNEVDKEIDWDEEGDPNKIPYEQAEDIQKIITSEASIYLLRRSTGVCGSLTDTMCEMREKLIIEYQNKWSEEYISYNDYL